MKNIKYKLMSSLIVLSMLFYSCGDEFGDTNLDPTRPGGENVSLVAITPAMQTQTHKNIMGESARLAGIIMQQLKGFDAQQVAFTQYAINEGTLDNYWQFGLYTGSMKDCVDMIERAEKDGNLPHTLGVAKIYLAVNLGLATNVWGDIPYKEALKGSENLTPKYDTQEDIYTSIQSLLDEAISDLSKNDPKGVLGDLLGRSAASWIKDAHALKARYYMQLSKRDSNAHTKALSEIALAFDSNSDSPIFNWENTQNGGSPFAKFGIGRPNTMVIGDYFANIMTNDPRKDKEMISDGATDYLFYQDGNSDLFWAQLDSPSPLISYWELKFIEAEATQRAGQDALALLKDAITANMKFMGIDDAAISTYTGAITSASLQTIIEEKYKSMYGCNPIEAWNDYRRTGFPALTADANGVNGSNPSGVIPRRFLYPRSERLGNPDSYSEALSRQGGHLQDIDMWAFKN